MNKKIRRRRSYIELPPVIRQGKKITFIVEVGGRALAIYFNDDKYDKYSPVGNLKKIGKKDTLSCKYKDEINQIWRMKTLWLRGMLWKYPEENAIYEEVNLKSLELAQKRYKRKIFNRIHMTKITFEYMEKMLEELKAEGLISERKTIDGQRSWYVPEDKKEAVKAALKKMDEQIEEERH